MAVDRVERLLRRLTGALESAGIEYAIIGGNAVAAWVSSVDEAAVRATKDVDFLIRRQDHTRVADAVRAIALTPIEVLGVHMFVDRRRPNPRTGAHIVFAGERIRPEYAHAAPDPSQSTATPAGFRVVDLPSLVAMKLQSYRFIDRAHIVDLLGVGLIDNDVRASLPTDLRQRLADVESENAL